MALNSRKRTPAKLAMAAYRKALTERDTQKVVFKLASGKDEAIMAKIKGLRKYRSTRFDVKFIEKDNSGVSTYEMSPSEFEALTGELENHADLTHEERQVIKCQSHYTYDDKEMENSMIKKINSTNYKLIK